MKKIAVLALVFVMLYLMQVVVCLIRYAVPHDRIVLADYAVELRYGMSLEPCFVPLLGWQIFAADGNRVLVFHNGVEVQRLHIDLFDDFPLEDVYVKEGQIFLPDA